VAQLNQDRYETLAARVLGVKGAGIFGHAEDAIFAGLALDTNAPVELWYPQRIYRYGAVADVPAHATQRGGLELRNDTQDQLWIVEHVNCGGPTGIAGFQLWMGYDTTADFYATVLLGGKLDTRVPGATTQDFGSWGTGLATIPGFTRIDMCLTAANTNCLFTPGVILAPGGSMIVNNFYNNMQCHYGISFHTRQAMPGELT